eukprot:scpid82389/ scgid27074/ 
MSGGGEPHISPSSDILHHTCGVSHASRLHNDCAMSNVCFLHLVRYIFQNIQDFSYAHVLASDPLKARHRTIETTLCRPSTEDLKAATNLQRLGSFRTCVPAKLRTLPTAENRSKFHYRVFAACCAAAYKNQLPDLRLRAVQAIAVAQSSSVSDNTMNTESVTSQPLHFLYDCASVVSKHQRCTVAWRRSTD